MALDIPKPKNAPKKEWRGGVCPDPIPALSIRQPWAWLIMHARKDIENRDWPTRYRGYFLVHAAKGMTRAEYESGAELYKRIRAQFGDPDMPAFEDLERGGIIGMVNLVDCVMDSGSDWFFGKYGFVLRDPQPLPFISYKGQLGFFKVDLPGTEN